MKIRDKWLATLFTAGMSISLITVSYGISLVNEWYVGITRGNSAITDFPYETVCTVEPSAVDGQVVSMEQTRARHRENLENVMKFLGDVRKEPFTIYLSDIYLQSENASSGIRVDVVLSENEGISVPLYRGSVPADLNDSSDPVVLNSAAMSCAVMKSRSKYINLGGYGHPVCGEYRDEYNYDPEGIIFYSGKNASPDDGVVSALTSCLDNGQSFRICQGSEAADAGTGILESEIENVLMCHSHVEADGDASDEGMGVFFYLRILISVVILIMSLYGLFWITGLYIQRKRRNLIIMKCCGMSNGRIAWKCLAETGAMSAAALIIVFIFNIAWQCVFLHGTGEIRIVPMDALLFLIMYTMIMALSGMWMGWYVKKSDPAELLRGYE